MTLSSTYKGWLVSKGHVKEAKSVLQRLNGGIEGYNVERETNIMCEVRLASVASLNEWRSLSYLACLMRAQLIYKGRREAVANKEGSFISIFKGTNGVSSLLQETSGYRS